MKSIQSVTSRLTAALRSLFSPEVTLPRSTPPAECGSKSLQREFVITSFRGGPLDGWTDIVEVTGQAPRDACLTLPISEDLLLDLQGMSSAYASSVITSFATYRLQKQPCRWVYEFVGSATSRAAAEGTLNRGGVGQW